MTRVGVRDALPSVWVTGQVPSRVQRRGRYLPESIRHGYRQAGVALRDAGIDPMRSWTVDGAAEGEGEPLVPAMVTTSLRSVVDRPGRGGCGRQRGGTRGASPGPGNRAGTELPSIFTADVWKPMRGLVHSGRALLLRRARYASA